MAKVAVELPDQVVLVMSRRAHAEGMPLGAYLRSELERLANEPDARASGGTARVELLEALDSAAEAAIDRDAVASELRDTLRMLAFERPQTADA